jgi:uncharacterized protein YacL
MKDIWTSFINRTIDLLFIKQPLRTSLGVILGLVLAFLVQLFLPTLKLLEFANFAGAPLWGWIVVGILFAHLPTFVLLMRTTPVGDEKVSDMVALIEKANFSVSEKRQAYRNLVVKVQENLVLNQRTNRKLREVQQRIENETEKR